MTEVIGVSGEILCLRATCNALVNKNDFTVSFVESHVIFFSFCCQSSYEVVFLVSLGLIEISR